MKLSRVEVKTYRVVVVVVVGVVEFVVVVPVLVPVFVPVSVVIVELLSTYPLCFKLVANAVAASSAVCSFSLASRVSLSLKERVIEEILANPTVPSELEEVVVAVPVVESVVVVSVEVVSVVVVVVPDSSPAARA